MLSDGAVLTPARPTLHALHPLALLPAYRCAALQVDGDKMSKSLGNFIILTDAVARWGADATRFALADAGDGLDDANFERETADNAILRLTTEDEYVRETLAAKAKVSTAAVAAPAAAAAAAVDSKSGAGPATVCERDSARTPRISVAQLLHSISCFLPLPPPLCRASCAPARLRTPTA
jgi:leucyl-tRNA synthetase